MAVAKALVTFGDLSWKGYFVMCSVLFSFVIMLLDIWTADMVMCFEVLLFLLLGILKPADALAGFSSSGVWSPAVMFMVAQGLSSTGGLDYIISKILGKPKDVTVGQIRLLLITLCFSSFVSDTAVTAIMIPIVIAYTQKARLPLKQFMSLLGYAALTGGTNTIIGTSTNLVISGMMNSRYGDKESPFFRPSYKPMSPFDLTPYGIQVSGWLIVWCILLSPLFLTDGEGWRKWINYFRRETLTSAWKAHQSFEVGLRVPPDSPAVGLTLLSAGLLDLNFLMPTRVVSSTGAERPNDPNTEIKPDDIIYFVGDITKIANVCLEWDMHPVNQHLELEQGGAAKWTGGKGLGDALGDTKGLEIEMPTVGGPVNRGPPILFTARIRGPSDARRPVGGDDRYCLRRWYHSTAENAAAAAALGGSHLIGQPAAEATAAFDGRHVVPIGVARRVGTGKNAKLEQIKAPLESITLEAGDEILLQTSPTFWAGSPAVRAAAASCEHVRFTGVVNEYYYPLEVKGRLTRMIEGLTLKNAGLKGLAGANLVGLQHADQAEPMKALSEEEKLTAGDVLTFAGTDRAIELIRKNPGLELQNAPELGRLRDAVVDRNLAQAVVAPLSPLIGKTPESVDFAATFQAVLLGINRQGVRLSTPLNLTPLEAGDVLMLEAGPTFLKHVAPENPCFSLVKEIEGTQPPRFWHTLITVPATVVCFTIYALGYRDIVTMMGFCAAIMIMSRTMSPATARRAIDWKILITIGAALGVSTAMEKSGAAEAIAGSLLNAAKGGGDAALIGIIYIVTMLVSQLIMNTPAASIIFPIAATIADQAGISIYLMAFAIMIAASAVYTTPFGDNINLMTSGVGDYSVFEFVRFGLPLQILMCITTTAILTVRQRALMATITGIATAAVVVIPHLLAGFQWWRGYKARKARMEAKVERRASFARASSMNAGRLSAARLGSAAGAQGSSHAVGSQGAV